MHATYSGTYSLSFRRFTAVIQTGFCQSQKQGVRFPVGSHKQHVSACNIQRYLLSQFPPFHGGHTDRFLSEPKTGGSIPRGVTQTARQCMQHTAVPTLSVSAVSRRSYNKFGQKIICLAFARQIYEYQGHSENDVIHGVKESFCIQKEGVKWHSTDDHSISAQIIFQKYATLWNK